MWVYTYGTSVSWCVVSVYVCVWVYISKYEIPLASIFGRLERCFCCVRWLLLLLLLPPFISSVYITVYCYILIIHQRIVCECMKCDSAAVLCGAVCTTVHTHTQRENSCFCQHITRWSCTFCHISLNSYTQPSLLLLPRINFECISFFSF